MPAILSLIAARLSALGDLLGYALLRVVCGSFLVAHGWPKWMAGVETFAANGLGRRGIEPALPLAWLVVSLETVGGALIAVGLLTRFAAGLATVHLAFITFWVLWPVGFAWNRGGWEFAAMWTAVLLLVTLKGGGTLSADRLLFGNAADARGRQA